MNDYENGLALIKQLLDPNRVGGIGKYEEDCIKQVLDFVLNENNNPTKLRRFSVWRNSYKQPTCVATYTTLENAIAGAEKYLADNRVHTWVSERYLNDLFVAVWESSPDVGMLGAQKKGNGTWPKVTRKDGK
jgi:hypothetical protein